MDVQMFVSRVIFCDPREHEPHQEPPCLVILGETDGPRQFSIVIGHCEAEQIYRRLRGIAPARPMVFELLASVLDAHDTQLERILIDDLQDNTFYAKLVLRRSDGQRLLIDSRPSDAIGLGVAHDTPIYVAEQVLATASS